jgi:hypothetical protein
MGHRGPLLKHSCIEPGRAQTKYHSFIHSLTKNIQMFNKYIETYGVRKWGKEEAIRQAGA